MIARARRRSDRRLRARGRRGPSRVLGSCISGATDSAISANPPVPDARSLRCGRDVLLERADADEHEAGKRDQRQAQHRSRGPHRRVTDAEREHRRQAAAQRRRGAAAGAARSTPRTARRPATRRRRRRIRRWDRSRRASRRRAAPRRARSAAPAMTFVAVVDACGARVGVAFQQRRAPIGGSSRARRARARAARRRSAPIDADRQPLRRDVQGRDRSCRPRRPTTCAGRRGSARCSRPRPTAPIDRADRREDRAFAR